MAMLSDRFRKWFLVTVMGLLMIAFTLPTWVGQGGGRQRDFPVGTLNNDARLMASEVQLARAEWQELSGISIPLMVDTGPLGQPQVVRAPLPAILFIGDLSRPVDLDAQRVIETLLTLYGRSPELYALLKREAGELGIRPSVDRVNSVMTNLVPPSLLTDTRRMASLRQAVVGLMAVEALRDQAMSAVKVTRPELTSLLARNLQTLSVWVVPVAASEFAGRADPPDEAALRQLFAEFADKTAGSFDRTTNPFGFGYRQGDRIALESVYVPRSELRRAARATREDYDWEVEAHKFYLSNRARFEVPSTQPADTFSLGGGSNTVRPFAEVRGQIEAQLVDARAEEIRRTVERRLTAALTSDFRSFADAKARGNPPPVTALGHPYDRFEYLSALADRIQRDTGVRPTVTTHGNRLLDRTTLLALDDVGQAFIETSGDRQVPLADYLLTRAKPLFDAHHAARETGSAARETGSAARETGSAARETGSAALEPLEPTPVASTFDGGLVIARFLDARPARVPEFEEVVDLVRADMVKRGEFELGKSAAQALADADPGQPLSGVAALQNRTALAIANLTDGVPLPQPLASLSPQGRFGLTEGAFDLLRRPEALTGGRPRAVVPLERDGLVVVVELESVTPLPRPTEPARLELQVFQQVLRQAETQYRLSFFLPDAVHQRTGFKPARPGDTTAASDL